MPDLLETLKRVILGNTLTIPCPSSYGLPEKYSMGKCLAKQGKQGASATCRGCWKYAFKQAEGGKTDA